MENIAFFDTGVFNWLILPLLIFLSRAVDVSLGTMRIIFVSKGERFRASLLGFFEILVWVLAITRIMQNVTNPLYYIAYAGGFAAGIFVGVTLENKLAMGMVSIHIFTKKGGEDLLRHLRSKNYGVTSRISHGLRGRVDELFTVLKRKNLEHVVDIVRHYDPEAFISIEDVRIVSGGIFPHKVEEKKEEEKKRGEGEREKEKEKSSK